MFVAGRANAVDHGDDYGTVAYAAATGTQQWAALYSGTGAIVYAETRSPPDRIGGSVNVP